MASGILSEMTIDDVRAHRTEVVVLGVASTEPHGAALPYGTDFYQCDGLCQRAVIQANERGGRVLQYPTLAIGNNVNFRRFPFSCRIRVRTLMCVILDIIAALEEDGVRKVVLVNGHGGNIDTLRAILREHFDITNPARRAFVCIPQDMASKEAKSQIKHTSDHGGEWETSQMMYLRPDLVQTEKFTDQPFGKPMLESIAAGKLLYVRPWHGHVPLSAGGEQRESSAEKGKALIESAAENLATLLVELSHTPWNPDFPYLQAPPK